MARVLYLVHHPTWTNSRIIDVLRAMGHEVELRCPPAGDSLPQRAAEFDGIVVSGHHWSVDEGHLHPSVDAEIALARAAVREGVPYFGMCFGAQALAAAHGCAVGGRADDVAEYGFYPLHATAAGAELFAGLSHVFQSHYQACLSVPEGGVLLASSEAFEVQAFRLGRSAFGVQFHPDARLDMIEGWWPDNEYLHHHPGIQPLAEQLVEAARHEDAIQGWVERFLEHWLPSPHRRGPERAAGSPASARHVSTGDLYAASHSRIVELVDRLADDTPVPATPPWTVLDVLAHLTGVASDLVSGNVAAWAQPHWTAAQVESRRGRSRAEVMAEWKGLLPDVCRVVSDPAAVDLHEMFGRMPMVDVIAHEDDLREACGQPRPIEPGEWAVIGVHRRIRFDDLFEELSLPPLRIRTPEGDDWVVGAPAGDREPVGEVVLSRHELWRSTTGRRPRPAVRAYHWTVDPEPYLPAWAGGTFKFPED